MQHKEFIIKNLKSAVAFFFLFFLHGTSIGTRQQGISYNEFWLCDGWALKNECSALAQKSNSSNKVQLITSAQLLQNHC